MRVGHEIFSLPHILRGPGYKFTPDEAILVEHAIEKHLEEEDAHDPASPRNSPSNFEHSPARVGPLSKRAVTRSVGEAEIMELQAMTGEWSDSSDGEDSDPGGFWVQLLASVACPYAGDGLVHCVL